MRTQPVDVGEMVKPGVGQRGVRDGAGSTEGVEGFGAVAREGVATSVAVDVLDAASDGSASGEVRVMHVTVGLSEAMKSGAASRLPPMRVREMEAQYTGQP